MTDIIPESGEWNESTAVDNHLCRICLSLTDLLIPIFEGEGIEQELHEKILKHLPIKISPSDTLPRQVCYICAGTIVAWNSLYDVCLKTDEKLQSFLSAEKKSQSTVVVIESDDEPLVSPKKRKLARDLSSKPDKTKRKVHLKKVKRVGKSPNRMNDEEGENNEESTENCSEGLKNASEREDLLTVIKTECDVEDDDAGNAEEGEGNGENAEGIKCEFCNKSYKGKKGLSRHMKKFHNEGKTVEAQRCNLCSNIYKTRANLDRHYLKEHLTDQVRCPVCRASFNSKKLDVHLKSVHGVKTESENEEKFKCKMCDKWFKNKYVRNSHVKEVHLSEPMKCKLCDFEGVRTVLRRHRRDVHAEKRFLCSLCPGAFKTLHTLKMHMTSHSDIRCYTCDICGMGFKRLNNVRDHMKCHEQKSNQCQICGNFFARKRYLAIHEKTIHNFYADGIVPEEKGFECGTCGAKLKWKKNLLAHMRIHTGEKPYVCKICNKDFICHGSLRTHMAKHSVCVPNEGDNQNHLTEVSVFNNFKSEQV